MNKNEHFKSGFVAVVGRPNVGKSTLINALIGDKIAIVSDKAQTTRNRIICVYTDEAKQIVFMDTPGVHKPKHKLGEFMVDAAIESLKETEAVLFVVAGNEKRGPGDNFIIEQLKRVKVPQKIKKPYTAEEREHLKDVAKTERDVAIMELLYSTAGRIGEVVALNRDDVDFVNREIIIYGQKGKKERKVYLTEGCVYHLKKYLESRDDNNPALFVRGRKPYNRLGRQAIQDMLRKLGAEAGVHAHPHKFRRTLLTDAGARGVPLQEIQAYAGHAKSDTTMLYVSVKQESVKASFMRLIA